MSKPEKKIQKFDLLVSFLSKHGHTLDLDNTKAAWEKIATLQSSQIDQLTNALTGYEDFSSSKEKALSRLNSTFLEAVHLGKKSTPVTSNEGEATMSKKSTTKKSSVKKSAPKKAEGHTPVEEVKGWNSFDMTKSHLSVGDREPREGGKPGKIIAILKSSGKLTGEKLAAKAAERKISTASHCTDLVRQCVRRGFAKLSK